MALASGLVRVLTAIIDLTQSLDRLFVCVFIAFMCILFHAFVLQAIRATMMSSMAALNDVLGDLL